MASFSHKRWSVMILITLILIYLGYQARFLILGPQISISAPKEGFVAEEALLTIKGRARNVAWISLNGKQIFTSPEGYWQENLLAEKGVNIITVEARDRFGRETEKQVEIYRK